MKIKFQKFAPTNAFIKLFGKDRHAGAAAVDGAESNAYEYYYKRGQTYYFRDTSGNKITINYDDPQQDLVRGQKYQIESIRNGQG